MVLGGNSAAHALVTFILETLLLCGARAQQRQDAGECDDAGAVFERCVAARYECGAEHGDGFRLDDWGENELRSSVQRCYVDNGCEPPQQAEFIRKPDATLSQAQSVCVDVKDNANAPAQFPGRKPKVCHVATSGQWATMKSCVRDATKTMFTSTMTQCMRARHGYKSFEFPDTSNGAEFFHAPRHLASALSPLNDFLAYALRLYAGSWKETADNCPWALSASAARECVLASVAAVRSRSDIDAAMRHHGDYCRARAHCTNLLPPQCRNRVEWRRDQPQHFCTCARGALADSRLLNRYVRLMFECFSGAGIAIDYDDVWYRSQQDAENDVAANVSYGGYIVQEIKAMWANEDNACEASAQLFSSSLDVCQANLFDIGEWIALTMLQGHSKLVADSNDVTGNSRGRTTRRKRQLDDTEQCAMVPLLKAMTQKSHKQCHPNAASLSCDSGGAPSDAAEDSDVSLDTLLLAAHGAFTHGQAAYERPVAVPLVVMAVERELLLAATRTPYCERLSHFGLAAGARRQLDLVWAANGNAAPATTAGSVVAATTVPRTTAASTAANAGAGAQPAVRIGGKQSIKSSGGGRTIMHCRAGQPGALIRWWHDGVEMANTEDPGDPLLRGARACTIMTCAPTQSSVVPHCCPHLPWAQESSVAYCRLASVRRDCRGASDLHVVWAGGDAGEYKCTAERGGARAEDTVRVDHIAIGTPPYCTSLFICHTHGLCAWRCDGAVECAGGEDEENCFGRKAGGRGMCYALHHGRPLNKAGAQADCERQGATLATVTDHREYKMLRRLRHEAGAERDFFYLDGFSGGGRTQGEWKLADGTAMPQFMLDLWARGQPDFENAVEHCVSLHRGTRGINDVGCGRKLGYFCMRIC